MKRCPTCNRTFDEDWLAFCTQDGTTLVEESASNPSEPPPTILSSPPPPPPNVQGVKQGIAVASMICGIFSITIGWCCYMGALTAPAAIGLGIYQMAQIKKDPEHNGGRSFAITGIITGAVYFVLVAIIILLYGMAILVGGLGNH